ncbi:MAG: SusC/RagA family TonB-linked outer membrane protein [Bacteroidota bacterium]
MKKSFFNLLIFSIFSFSSWSVAWAMQAPLEEAEADDLQSTQADTLPVIDHGIDKLISLSDFEIEPSQVKNMVTMDIFSNMEGAVPGLDISPVGAEPAAYVRMLIRGIGSVNGANEPLIVIDGVPFENATLNSSGYRFSGLAELDAADFESVEILKGPASTALYGARGANGVIAITTKEGNSDERKIHLSYRQGVSSSPKKMDLLGADQFMDVLNQAYENSYPDADEPAPVDKHTYDGFYSQTYEDSEGTIHQPNLSNTDWYNNMHMQGVNHYVRGSVQGGDDRTSYFAAGTYRSDESFLYRSAHDRANFRLNLTNQMTNRLKLGLRLYIASNRRDINSRQWFETAHTSALPVYPVQSPTNQALYWYNEDNPTNIQALNERSWDKTGGMRTLNTGFAEFKIPEGLTINSLWSWDFQHYLNEDYKHPFVAPSDNGLLIIGRYDRSNWSGNNFVNYQNTFGKHSLDLTGGFSLEDYNWNGNTIYNPGMTLLFVHTNGESNQLREAWTHVENYRFYSGYGNLRYNFDEKYLVNLTLRSDASSRFGKENRMHHFPAASVGWIMSKENFLSNISAIDYLEVHAGYGIVGNAQMSNFLHLSSLGPSAQNDPDAENQGYYRYGEYPAVVPVNMGNPMLGPEKSTKIDAGIRFALLQNRISGKISYFSYNNSQLLNNAPVSVLYGYENTQRWENDGELNTQGMEIFLSPQIVESENGFNWSMDINLSTVNTTLTQLPENKDYLESFFNRSYENEPLAGYYVAEWAGVDPETGHELVINPETGEATDAEVLNDEEFLAMATYFADKTPFPNLYGGIRNNFSFRGFDLSFLFTTRQGHYLLDLGEQSMSYIGSGSTAKEELAQGWSSQNPTNLPLLYDTQMSERVTSRFLHDASYFRLQEVAVSFLLPKTIAGWNYNQDVTLFFIGNNLLTITDFPGYDPNGIHSTYSSMSNMDAGLLMFDPPIPRTFMFGISVGI